MDYILAATDKNVGTHRLHSALQHTFAVDTSTLHTTILWTCGMCKDALSLNKETSSKCDALQAMESA